MGQQASKGRLDQKQHNYDYKEFGGLKLTAGQGQINQLFGQGSTLGRSVP